MFNIYDTGENYIKKKDYTQGSGVSLGRMMLYYLYIDRRSKYLSYVIPALIILHEIVEHFLLILV